MKVTRNRVGLSAMALFGPEFTGVPGWSGSGCKTNPECTESLGEFKTACKPPSGSTVTLLEGSNRSKGSCPGVMVLPFDRVAYMNHDFAGDEADERRRLHAAGSSDHLSDASSDVSDVAHRGRIRTERSGQFLVCSRELAVGSQYTDRHPVARVGHRHPIVVRTHGVIVIGQQTAPLFLRLLVVEGLVIRQGRGGIENVDGTVHRAVNQALKPVVPGRREAYGDCRIPFDGGRRRNASRAIEAGGANGKPGAAYRERGEVLPYNQKRDGVNFIGVESPRDAVAGMDPHFVRQKSERLPAHARGLRTNFGRPVLLCGKWPCKAQKGQSGKSKQDAVARNPKAILHTELLSCLP